MAIGAESCCLSSLRGRLHAQGAFVVDNIPFPLKGSTASGSDLHHLARKVTMDVRQKAGLASGLGVVASSILIGMDASRSYDTLPASFPSSIVANMPKELPNGLPIDPPDVLVAKFEQYLRRRRLLNAGLAASGRRQEAHARSSCQEPCAGPIGGGRGRLRSCRKYCGLRRQLQAEYEEAGTR